MAELVRRDLPHPRRERRGFGGLGQVIVQTEGRDERRALADVGESEQEVVAGLIDIGLGDRGHGLAVGDVLLDVTEQQVGAVLIPRAAVRVGGEAPYGRGDRHRESA